MFTAGVLDDANEIIKQGRLALAKKHHPDKGDTTPYMAIVNQAEQWMTKRLFS
jgi:hypothetical protein